MISLCKLIYTHHSTDVWESSSVIGSNSNRLFCVFKLEILINYWKYACNSSKENTISIILYTVVERLGRWWWLGGCDASIILFNENWRTPLALPEYISFFRLKTNMKLWIILLIAYRMQTLNYVYLVIFLKLKHTNRRTHSGTSPIIFRIISGIN